VAGAVAFLPIIFKTIKTLMTKQSLSLGQAAAKAFNSGLGPYAIIVVAVAAAIAAVVAGIKKLQSTMEANSIGGRISALEEDIDNATESATKLKEALSKTTEEKKSLEEIKETYNELKNKLILTEEEQEEYNSMVETLKESYPELITYYDEQNNKITISNSLLDEQIEKVSALQKLESQQVLAADYKTEGLQNQYDTLNEILSGYSKFGFDATWATEDDNIFKESSFNTNTISMIDEEGLLDIYNKYLNKSTPVVSMSAEDRNAVINAIQYAFSGDYAYLSGISDNYKEGAQALANAAESEREIIDGLKNDFAELYSYATDYYSTNYSDMTESEQDIRGAIAAAYIDKLNDIVISDSTDM
jgi:hypothetical protein